MKSKNTRYNTNKRNNWRIIATNRPVFWIAVVVLLLIVFTNPTIQSSFRAVTGRAFSWVTVQITDEPGFEWAIDASSHKVLVAKGTELGNPLNLYVYNTDTPQKPPIQVLEEDLPEGDSYLASAKISLEKVVYTKLRSDGQGSSVWMFSINSDNTGGVNTLMSPENSSSSSKKWRVRPDISAAHPMKIIYQEFDMWAGGQIRRGNLVMIDAEQPLATPVVIAQKVAIVGNRWEYEDPSVMISPKIDPDYIVWRDLIGTDMQSVQVAMYYAKINDPTNKMTLLPPSYFPSVGSFDIGSNKIVASVTTKGIGGKTNTNIFSCTIFNCMPSIKLVNTQTTDPSYVATQAATIQGIHVVYMVEKPKSTTNPAPVHQQWRYHNTDTGEDNLIAELGSSTNTTVLTERYERAIAALLGPTHKLVSVITRREAPSGLVSQTEANIFAGLGL